MKARPYQLDCYHSIRDAFKRRLKRVAVELATGCGKTIIFAFVARDVAAKGGRTLVLVNRDNLAKQAADKIQKVTGDHPSVEKGEEKGSRLTNIVVGSVQSMQGKRLESWPKDHFKMIIVDECHQATAKSYRALMNHFADAYWLGLTATIDRHDKQGIFFWFEEVVYEFPIVSRKDIVVAVRGKRNKFKDFKSADKFLDGLPATDILSARIEDEELPGAIDEGWLVPIRTKQIPVPISIAEGIAKKKHLTEDEEAYQLEPYLKRIALAMKDEIGSMKTLCFLPDCESSMAFAQMLRDVGIRAGHVEGVGSRPVYEKDDEGKIIKDANGKPIVKFTRTFTKSQYDEVYEAFRDNELQVVCNSQIWYIGFDMPDIQCVAPLRLIKSTPMLKQIIGRGTRVVADIDSCATAEERRAAIAASAKPHALILDLMFQMHEHDFATPASLVSDLKEERKITRDKPGAPVQEDIEALNNQIQSSRVSGISEKLRKMADAIANKSARNRQKKDVYLHDVIRAGALPGSNMATEKQKAFIRSLSKQCNVKDELHLDHLSGWQASRIISRMMKAAGIAQTRKAA